MYGFGFPLLDLPWSAFVGRGWGEVRGGSRTLSRSDAEIVLRKRCDEGDGRVCMIYMMAQRRWDAGLSGKSKGTKRSEGRREEMFNAILLSRVFAHAV